MKVIITTIFAIITIAGNAQISLVPGRSSFEKAWIKNETYQMTWFAIRDTVKFEIGEVDTQILTDKKFVTIVTEVKLKNSKAPWIDTTIADISTLAPIRHTSYNMQRDMVLNFGKIVTGSYNDKLKQQDRLISDTTGTAYFDSNIYPALIAWLPLNEGYKQNIAIYDYNPSGKTGVIKASIENVASGIYESIKSGSRNVWVVTVTDEIGNGKDGFMIYYIDKNDRKLWKQEINAGGRKMIMQRKEL
ncbi:MAG: hypothetical protein JWR72_3792 [Flavisolibacter sp.]|nr:hypothetical protein [Flavisolibacter sp.]